MELQIKENSITHSLVRFWIKTTDQIGEKWESIDIEVSDDFLDDETQIHNLASDNTIHSYDSYEILWSRY